MSTTIESSGLSSRVELPDLDLEIIASQMRSDLPYRDWPATRMEMALSEYRRFLALCKAFPNALLGISGDADKVWHRHILNTRKYAIDCQSYFGWFLHHTPEFDVAENRAAQAETDRLYLDVFGVPRQIHQQATCVASGCMNNG